MVEKSKSKDLSTLTIQDVWIPQNLFLDMFLLCLVQQSVGKLPFKRLEPYQPLKLNTLPSSKFFYCMHLIKLHDDN